MGTKATSAARFLVGNQGRPAYVGAAPVACGVWRTPYSGARLCQEHTRAVQRRCECLYGPRPLLRTHIAPCAGAMRGSVCCAAIGCGQGKAITRPKRCDAHVPNSDIYTHLWLSGHQLWDPVWPKTMVQGQSLHCNALGLNQCQNHTATMSPSGIGPLNH